MIDDLHFFRPTLPDQVGKTGNIDFKLEVVPNWVPSFTNVFSGWDVRITGKTAADDRALCEVLNVSSDEWQALGNFQSKIAIGITADQQNLAPEQRITTDDSAYQIAVDLTSPGGGLYESCVSGRIWTYLDDSTNLTIAAKISNELTPSGYDAVVLNSSNARLIQVDGWADGGSQVLQFDPGGFQSWDREIARIYPNGLTDKIVINDNETVASATYGGASIAGDIGGAFGSNFGRLLGGNTLTGQVLAGTLAGAIGKEIATSLFQIGTYTLDGVFNAATGSLQPGTGSLSSVGIGAVSSLLIGEVASKLHLSGFANGLFQTVGTSVTTQLLTNIYNVTVLPGGSAAGLFGGFDATAFEGNIAGALGSYLGSTLAAEVVKPHFHEGGVGASIGSSIGGSVGAGIGLSVGGPVGALMLSFVGSFAGQLAGTALGDVFGHLPQAHGEFDFNLATHRFEINVNNFGGSDNGNPGLLGTIALQQMETLHKLADFAGAQLEGINRTYPPFVVPDSRRAL